MLLLLVSWSLERFVSSEGIRTSVISQSSTMVTPCLLAAYHFTYTGGKQVLVNLPAPRIEPEPSRMRGRDRTNAATQTSAVTGMVNCCVAWHLINWSYCLKTKVSGKFLFCFYCARSSSIIFSGRFAIGWIFFTSMRGRGWRTRNSTRQNCIYYLIKLPVQNL